MSPSEHELKVAVAYLTLFKVLMHPDYLLGRTLIWGFHGQLVADNTLFSFQFTLLKREWLLRRINSWVNVTWMFRLNSRDKGSVTGHKNVALVSIVKIKSNIET